MQRPSEIKFLKGNVLLFFCAQQFKADFVFSYYIIPLLFLCIYVYINGDFTVRITIYQMGLSELENLLSKFRCQTTSS